MKMVVITGATRGLGLETTRQALENGYKVIAIARAISEPLKQLRNQYTEQLVFEAFDFNDLSDIHKLAAEISKNHGRPWGLINNAALGNDGILATLHEKDISQLIRVNIEAPILLTKYLIRPMLINQQGRIINISSIIASTGFSGLSVYAATKAALTGFTKSLAREIGKVGITVNTISPGYMETDMTNELQGDKKQTILRRSPLGRLASTKDVASAIIYLLSENSSSITGTEITIDAGSTA